MASREEDIQDLAAITKISDAGLEWKVEGFHLPSQYSAKMKGIYLLVFRSPNLINLRFRKDEREEFIARQVTSRTDVKYALDNLYELAKEVAEHPPDKRTLINEILEEPKAIPDPQVTTSPLSSVEIGDFDRRL